MKFSKFTIIISVCSAMSLVAAGNIAPRNNGQSTSSSGKVNTETREIANLRADFRILQEDNQKLSLRIESLEMQNRELESRLQELSNLISTLNEQIDANERGAAERMEAEKNQRQKDMQNLADNVAKQLSSGQASTNANRNTVGDKYSKEFELTVKEGDTLSSIAKAVNIPWKDIYDYNGLTTDKIRVGQVLKIPVK